MGRRIYALTVGDDAALTMGVNPDRMRVILVVLTCILVGSVVAMAGSIGFVGLVIPHAARRLVGGSHRHMILVAALLGASLLISADTRARTLLAPQEIPIGIFDLPGRRTIFDFAGLLDGSFEMITAENVSYQEIIKDISFEIPDHGVVGLVGPNGSGKTTLLRTLFGALQPTEGRVLLNGAPLASMRARKIAHELSVVAQDSGEPPQMTVAEVVRLGRLPHKDNSDDGIIAALKSVGMLHKAQAPLTHLSGGERQRVMIARAFIQDASHILLDEPTNHLDIHYQLEVFKLIKDYRANATVVLHDLNMALEYCDWIHLLEEGRLVESGPPGDVLVPESLEPIYNVRVVRTEHHLHFERLEK